MNDLSAVQVTHASGSIQPEREAEDPVQLQFCVLEDLLQSSPGTVWIKKGRVWLTHQTPIQNSNIRVGHSPMIKVSHIKI